MLVYRKKSKFHSRGDGDVITLAARNGRAFEVRLCEEEAEKQKVIQKRPVDAEALGASLLRRFCFSRKAFPRRRLRRKTQDPTWAPAKAPREES